MDTNEVPGPLDMMAECPTHGFRPIVSMGPESVTLSCGYVVM